MISLPKLKFDTFSKRAFFISNNMLASYHLDHGKLNNAYLFQDDEHGISYFQQYLQKSSPTPVYVLLDIQQEEYRLESIPHVSGRDRISIFHRKRLRLFHDTPYFYARVQYREKSGRQDDHALMVAITAPNIISKWIKIIHRCQVPLAGIYSLPLLSEVMLNTLPHISHNVLLFSLQNASGLRQSFFQYKKLQFSRLVPKTPGYENKKLCSTIIKKELDRVQLYLENHALMKHNERLDIYFLGSQELLDGLSNLKPTSILTHYHMLNINEFGRQSNIQKGAKLPSCEQLYVQELLHRKPPNIYASKKDKRHFKTWKISKYMIACSLIFLMTSSVISGVNFVNGLAYQDQQSLIAERAHTYSSYYKQSRKALTTTMPADELKIIVDAAKKLRHYQLEPFDMLGLLSQAMDIFESVELDYIKWTGNTDPNFNPNADKPAPIPESIPINSLAKSDEKENYYQIAIINGHLRDFDGDYRIAISTIDNFANLLGESPTVYKSSVLNYPLDISSSTTILGSTKEKATKANFSLRLVLENEI